MGNKVVAPLTNEAALQVFKNEAFGQVRVILINGEPWWIGKDVATALGYQRTADAIREHVDEEDKGVGKIQTPGGIQEMVIINESGLYSLILSSNLPNIKGFKRWVTHEVLPSIRKTGFYSTKPISTVDGLLAAVQILKDHEDRLNAVEQQQATQQARLDAATLIQNNQQEKLVEVTQAQQTQEASIKDLQKENTTTSNRLAILEAGNQNGAKYYPYPDGTVTKGLLNRIWNMCQKLHQQLPEYDYSEEMWHVKYKEVLLSYLQSRGINIHRELVEAKQYYTQVYTTEKAQGITPAKEVLRPASINKVTMWQVLCLNPEYIEIANAIIGEFEKRLNDNQSKTETGIGGED